MRIATVNYARSGCGGDLVGRSRKTLAPKDLSMVFHWSSLTRTAPADKGSNTLFVAKVGALNLAAALEDMVRERLQDPLLGLEVLVTDAFSGPGDSWMGQDHELWEEWRAKVSYYFSHWLQIFH
jgi:hypothetical protein